MKTAFQRAQWRKQTGSGSEQWRLIERQIRHRDFERELPRGDRIIQSADRILITAGWIGAALFIVLFLDWLVADILQYGMGG